MVNQALAGFIRILASESELESEESAALVYQRPVKITRLGREAAPLAKGGSVGYDDLKDFTWLFVPHCDWIVDSVSSLIR